MIARCHNPQSKDYFKYGKRGIRVCQRWRESAEAFISDIGPRPSPKHSVDRINNDGDYEPGNCRWATMKEQCRNGRHNVYLTFRGKTLLLMDWADILKINAQVLRCRIYCGWSVKDALTIPVKDTGRRKK